MTRQPVYTEEWLQQAQQRMGRGSDSKRVMPRKDTPRVIASAPSPTKPFRSKLEKSWSNSLEMAKLAGEIANFWYEPLNLRLPGKRNFYKPDFLVLAGDGLTFYEVKGRNKSDDRSLVKMKTAAGLTPWARFVLVKRQRGVWTEKVIA